MHWSLELIVSTTVQSPALLVPVRYSLLHTFDIHRSPSISPSHLHRASVCTCAGRCAHLRRSFLGVRSE